jgi:probable rRNA maturation factor
MMTVFFENKQRRYDVDEIQKLIESVVDTSLKVENIDAKCQVSIMLVDDIEIREINCKYRGIDRATDVLSFPMLEKKDYKNIDNMDLDTGELVLGDIVISLNRADEQSKEYGHSFDREVAYLTSHGMLHLLGYDHEDEDERKVMRDKEEKILGFLNLNR